MRICGLGDNTVDEYVHQGVGFPGGNAVNVAVMAGALGASAAYLGVVGSDARGRFLLEQLREHGVDTARVRVVPGPNAWCTVALDQGNRRFASFQPEPEPLVLTPDDLGYLAGFDLVHCGYAARLGFAIAELARQVRLSYDFGERPTSVDPDLIPHLRVASFSRSALSEDETVEFVRTTQEQGPPLVIVTRGARGAVLANGSEIHVQPAAAARVVDTLGAGDAFIAAVLVALDAGETLATAGAGAAEAAARACERYGAFGTGRPSDVAGTPA